MSKSKMSLRQQDLNMASLKGGVNGSGVASIDPIISGNNTLGNA